MTAPKYHINLFWSDEDNVWIADVPDLWPCASHGNSPEEATANIQDAIAGWLQVARERDFPIPEPTYRSPSHGSRAAA